MNHGQKPDATRTPHLIWRAQRLWRRWVQLTYWFVVCYWLKAWGRLYWFKRAPDWFVWFVASAPDEGSEEDAEFFDAAFDERELRRQVRKTGQPQQVSERFPP
jgi:hypothetical protein